MNHNKIGLEAGDDFIMSDKSEDALEKAVGERLLKNGFTVALAESCTGGLLGAKITSAPGSSIYFIEWIDKPDVHREFSPCCCRIKTIAFIVSAIRATNVET